MEYISAGHPPRCTTDIAFVRDVIKGAIELAVIDPTLGQHQQRLVVSQEVPHLMRWQ